MRKPYSCLKITLLVLNTVFLAMGIILFASGAYAYSNLSDLAQLVSVGLPIGLIVIGIFIFLLSFFGCCSVAVENRIMLLIYVFVLLILLVCQIAIGAAAYSQAGRFEKTLAQNWNIVDQSVRDQLQARYACCGFETPDASCQNTTTTTCATRIVNDFKNKLTLVGAMGVIFGCLEIVGLCFALVLYCCIGSKHRREKKERLLG